MIRAPRRCGLVSDYFDHLFLVNAVATTLVTVIGYDSAQTSDFRTSVFPNFRTECFECYEFLPTRRYASAGTCCGHVSVSVACVCLCLPITMCRCSIKRDERINLVLTWRLLSTSPTLCYKEVRVSTKIRVLLSGTVS